jgi:hypothetical protein
MEIQAFLLSDALPRDIVIDCIYRHMYIHREALPPDLKKSIVNNHFLFKKMLLGYYNLCYEETPLYSRDPLNDDFFLNWVENDIICIMNDDQFLMNGLSPELVKECPEITLQYLNKKVETKELPERIYDLWCMMTSEKQIKIYQQSINNRYTYNNL